MRLAYRVRMSRRAALLVVAAALVATACSGPSMEELTQAADAVVVTADWELVAEEVAKRPCPDPVENCPAVKRTYEVPGATDFGVVISQMLEGAGFDVWDPPGSRCGSNPEQGCNAGARRGDVSLRAIVVDVATGSYTVTVRSSEYVGP